MAKKNLWQFQWYFWVVGIILCGAVINYVGLQIATSHQPTQAQVNSASTMTPDQLAKFKEQISKFNMGRTVIETGTTIMYMGVLVLIFAVLLLLAKLAKDKNEANDKLENILQTLNSNRTLLMQISHGVRLSEAAKTFVFRDMDRQSIREAVLEKLHQQDFDATYAIIEELAHRPGYESLAPELKSEADGYHNATEEERINKVIAHVESLCQEHQWTRATAQAERLLKAYPTHLKVQGLPQMITDRKEQRKRELLAAWDDAVKRQATDQSLEILRELDLYLTPNEGLALQESARDVFRNKLHGLGVQFSLSVTEKRWGDALGIGEQIMRDFPNSRMAQEIREKYEVLKTKAANA